MTLKLILISIALSLSSTAGAQWTNEPAGSTALLDCAFNNPTCDGGLWDVYGTAKVRATHSDAPVSPSSALVDTLAPGANEGGAVLVWPETRAKARPLKELYVGLMWKINSQFQGYNSNSNKVFFMMVGNYPMNGGTNAGGVFTVTGQPDAWPMQLVFGPNTGGVDNSHACGGGGFQCWPNAGSVPIYRDTWYKVEAYIKASSCVTCRDATVKWWVNGVLIGNYQNLNYGTGLVNEFQINHTWDGQPSASCYNATTNPGGRDCSRTWEHIFDHVRISAPNCGSACTGAPAAPPPPPPTTPPPPPPPVAANPGTVTNLAVSQIGATGLTLSFNQVDDGTGAPAKYAIRYSSTGSLWGGGSDVTQGTCAAPLQGTATGGSLTCTVAGLSSSTAYEFQLVAFRGTLNQGAIYGGLSNVASATTSAGQTFASTDVNQDGNTTVTDVQLAVNQTLGLTACSSTDVDKNGSCNVADIQKIVNAALGMVSP